MNRSVRLLLSMGVAAVSACEATPPPPSSGEVTPASAPLDSGVITAAAACPCTHVATVAAADGHIELIVRSAGDGGLWHISESEPNGGYGARQSRITLPSRRTTLPTIPPRVVLLPPERTLGAPTAVLDPSTGALDVFYVRDDGAATLMLVAGSPDGQQWTASPALRAGMADPAAFVDDASSGGQLRLLATASADGSLQVGTRATSGGAWSWTSPGPLPNNAKISGRPRALIESGIMVAFVRDSGGNAWSISETSPGGDFAGWRGLGNAGVGFRETPEVGLDASGRIAAFGIGSDGKLYSTTEHQTLDATFPGWTSLSGPGWKLNGLALGVNRDGNQYEVSPHAGRLELFYSEWARSFGIPGTVTTVSQTVRSTQCQAASWVGAQTTAETGDGLVGPDVMAAASEADTRLVAFRLDAAGTLHYSREQVPVRAVAPWGAVNGVYQCGAAVYRGLRYAEPPARWQSAQPLQQHPGQGFTFKNACLQTRRGAAHIPQSEDCLTLDIYTPAAATNQPALPVMVFVHGGGNQNGDSRQYSGAQLAVTQALATPQWRLPGVVVVNVNYRLGLFGWLAHPGLSQEGGGSSGNYGISDLRAALLWIQKNIGNFNGDASHVMVFGQSAGAGDIEVLLSSPQSAGLVSAAGIHSSSKNYLPTRAEREPLGTALSHALGCDAARAGSPAQLAGCERPGDELACMRCVPAKTLKEVAAATVDPTDSWGSSVADDIGLPNIDGVVVVDHPINVLSKASVPLLLGTTREETGFGAPWVPGIPFPADCDYACQMHAYFDGRLGVANATKLINVDYPTSAYASAPWAFVTAGSDEVTCANRRLAVAAAAHARVYPYLFTHRLDAPADVMAAEVVDPVSQATIAQTVPLAQLGAYHTEDIGFFMGTLGALLITGPYDPSAAEWDLSAKMMGYWARFALTGNPNGGDPTDMASAGDGPLWRALDASDATVPYMQLETGAGLGMAAGYHVAQCQDFAAWLPPR